MRILLLFFIVALASLIGCSDRPEVAPETYGTVLRELPRLDAAEEPFKFPHAGENDHRNCVFKEEDFF